MYPTLIAAPRLNAPPRAIAYVASFPVARVHELSTNLNSSKLTLMTANEQFIAWLNSAHSMEISLAKVLENHAKDAKEFPEIQQRIQQHLGETQRHAKRVEECLNILGEKPSTTKSIFGNITGMVQSVSTGMFRDELVKNFLSDYAAENFEIACYRSLATGAETLGQRAIGVICEEILMEEEAMAQWLEDRIPEVTRMMLHQDAHV
jgi:ferritin-like metal-binding protein YciE